MSPLNKFRTMPIRECGERMVAIPRNLFLLADPHPYVKAGAPYNGASPWMLREGVVEALKKVRTNLLKYEPDWNLLITDAYRPDSAHEFMVGKAFREAAQQMGYYHRPFNLDQQTVLDKIVHRLWARPCDDPLQPTPHSTGGALDLTFADKYGIKIYMGSQIDKEPGADPDYYVLKNPRVHARRELLGNLMAEQGFRRANDEYWHFSLGDQFWAYYQKEAGIANAAARYGRTDLLPQPKF